MNCTLLVIDSDTKTKEEIEKFFGKGLYTLNEVTHYNSTPYRIFAAKVATLERSPFNKVMCPDNSYFLNFSIA